MVQKQERLDGLKTAQKLKAGIKAHQEKLAKLVSEDARKKASQRRKAETRVKIIVGSVVLATPVGEREALLAMLLPRMTGRDQATVNEYLAGEQPTD